MPFRRTYYFRCTPGPGKFFPDAMRLLAVDSLVDGRYDGAQVRSIYTHWLIVFGAPSGSGRLACAMRLYGR